MFKINIQHSTGNYWDIHNYNNFWSLSWIESIANSTCYHTSMNKTIWIRFPKSDYEKLHTVQCTLHMHLSISFLLLSISSWFFNLLIKSAMCLGTSHISMNFEFLSGATCLYINMYAFVELKFRTNWLEYFVQCSTQF